MIANGKIGGDNDRKQQSQSSAFSGSLQQKKYNMI